METVLVTGVAGFIGFHLARELLARGQQVVGIDSLDAYYDPALKRARLAQLQTSKDFRFQRLDLRNSEELLQLFARQRFGLVLHMAAQPGVRHSREHPQSCIESNVIALVSLLEACRRHRPAHFVFASSSSVYGLSRRLPYSVHDDSDHPASLYAASKRAGELIVHSYAHLDGLPATGLRFFTVYGPWGRPDMAPMKFLDALLAGRPLEIYNHGHMRRDFTYVDDIVASTLALAARIPAPDAGNSVLRDPATSSAPFRLYNIGSRRPVALPDFIAALEQATSRRALRRFLPMQPGDVLETHADIDDTLAATHLPIETPLAEGVARFVDWYGCYYRQQGLAS